MGSLEELQVNLRGLRKSWRVGKGVGRALQEIVRVSGRASEIAGRGSVVAKKDLEISEKPSRRAWFSDGKKNRAFSLCGDSKESPYNNWISLFKDQKVE